MAAAIALAAPVKARPEVLFKALTEKSGLSAFWTDDSEAEPVVGSIAHFGFPSGAKVDVRIDDLEPVRRVAWTMLTDTLRGPTWRGTKVTWDLKALDGGFTEVLFRQTEWPEENFGQDWQTSLAEVNFIWACVLRALKGFAETGIQQPHFVNVPR